ncbi:hypothetical protein [Rubritalea tangerina]
MNVSYLQMDTLFKLCVQAPNRPFKSVWALALKPTMKRPLTVKLPTPS